MQNNLINIRITSPLVSQHSFVVFEFKTETSGPELHVFMCSRPHLLFFAFKTVTLAPELEVSMGASFYLLFCAFTTATL